MKVELIVFLLLILSLVGCVYSQNERVYLNSSDNITYCDKFLDSPSDFFVQTFRLDYAEINEIDFVVTSQGAIFNISLFEDNKLILQKNISISGTQSIVRINFDTIRINKNKNYALKITCPNCKALAGAEGSPPGVGACVTFGVNNRIGTGVMHYGQDIFDPNVSQDLVLFLMRKND